MLIIGITVGILIILSILLSRKKKSPDFKVIVTPTVTPSALPGHSYWRAGEYECSEGYCANFKGAHIVIVPETLNPTIRKAVFDKNNPTSIFLLEEKLENAVLDYRPVTDIADNCKEACSKIGKL